MGNIKKIDKSDTYLIIAIIVVIVLQNIHTLRFLMYPFNLLATWIHEMSHGLTAAVLGGNFKKLVINSDTSGYAQYAYNPLTMGTFAKATIASAGYMGTAIFGTIMLFFRKKDKFVKVFSILLGALMILSLIIYIRSWVGLFFALPFSAFLLFIGLKSNAEFNKFFYNFLASQIALNSLLDIKVLFSVGNKTGGVAGMASLQSDAAKVADLLILPYWFWAGLWLLTSVLLFLFAFFKPLGGGTVKEVITESTINNI